MREEHARLDEEAGVIELGAGEVIVRVPFQDMWKAYTKLRSKLGATDYESPEVVMAGFWDWTKKISRVVKAVVASPVVKMVAGAVPVIGGTLRTALDAADMAVKAVDSVTKKMPPQVKRLVADVAAKKPAAQAAMSRLSPAAQRKVKKMVVLRLAMHKTVKDATELRRVAQAAGYTPALVNALRLPRAPWRR